MGSLQLSLVGNPIRNTRTMGEAGLIAMGVFRTGRAYAGDAARRAKYSAQYRTWDNAVALAIRPSLALDQ